MIQQIPKHGVKGANMLNLIAVLPDDPTIIWKAFTFGLVFVLIGLIGWYFSRKK